MINLMVKNIFENKINVEKLTNYVNKTNKILCVDLILIAVTLYAIVNKIDEQQEEIDNLKNEIKEMKSKGE